MSAAEAGERLRAYAAAFERLTEARLPGLADHLAPGVRFKDPFNDVSGVDAYLQIFRHMFAALVQPVFEVHHQALAGGTGYLYWTLTFRASAGAATRRIEGLSRVRFDAEGRITEHVDYWDPAEQLYADVPVLGWVLRRVRRRLSAPTL